MMRGMNCVWRLSEYIFSFNNTILHNIYVFSKIEMLIKDTAETVNGNALSISV